MSRIDTMTDASDAALRMERDGLRAQVAMMETEARRYRDAVRVVRELAAEVCAYFALRDYRACFAEESGHDADHAARLAMPTSAERRALEAAMAAASRWADGGGA